MTDVAPPDAASRERVLTELGTTLFVEAGAGTGKTTALVGRILSLVATGEAQLREVAAITFTEAAAAQLRDRVRAAVEHAAGDTGRPAEQRERMAVAATQVDEAAILTLHGFAQAVLAEHPIEAGLPPEFEIVDELRAAELLDEAWAELQEDLLSDPGLRAPMETALTLGLTLYSLERLARAAAEAYDRLAEHPPAGAPPGRAPAEDLADRIAATARWRARNLRPDALLDHLDDLAELARALRAAPGELEGLRLLAGRKLSCSRGQKGDWDGGATDIKHGLADLERQRRDVLAHAGRTALAPILERVRAWALAQARRRRTQGQLTFHDLLVAARDLLRDHAETRGLAASRWRRLLIDEFQDTDPLQVDIALALAETDPRPGRLFFVGDPKQSIYRFRRADIAVYGAARERFADGLVPLVANFRTVPGVVAWVNAVFAGLMDGEPGQAPFAPLLAMRPALRDGPAVHVVGGPCEKLPAAEAREREATAVARAVRAVRDEGWPVHDAHDKVTRPARYADIALLLPARTALPAVERALEDAGVPYRVEARSLVYESQEARELLALLRAADDPTDEVAVVAALRGPALACPDDALAQWAAAGGGWDYRQAAPAGAPDIVAEAMRRLAACHAARFAADPAALVDLLVRELRLLELGAGRPRPRDAWRRLRYVIDEARALAERGGSLRELVRRIERQAADQVRVTEQVLPDEDDDAVRILTMHAAKGLEFGVTVLCGLAGAGGGGGDPLLWDAGGQGQVRLGDHLETQGYAEAKEAERLAQRQEHHRLLYVAATRARDHLILSLAHTPPKASPAGREPQGAELLWERSAGCAQLWRRWEPPEPVDVRDPAEGAAAPAGPADAAGLAAAERAAAQAWLDKRGAALSSRARLPVGAATALTAQDRPEHSGHDPADDSGEHPQADEHAALPPFRRGRAGTAIGRAVHAVLQTIPFDAAAALVAAAARAQADAEGIPGRAGEVAALVASALRSAPVRAASAGRSWRELPVAAPVGGLLLEGYVDLLYEQDGELVLVDYKSDRVDDASLAATTERYATQLGAYALALEAVLSRRVARAALVFVREGEARVAWVDDLAAAAARARELVAAHAAPPSG
ncbi:MAG TPA: UvrD-helicase domain-containing protein [Egibacteraceae bacterium]|nr:UvrD-helicase domain-containing protein [Egibacteraceae bacterium]